MSKPIRSFAELLHSDGPAPDRAEKMSLYGWLIGAWEMDTVVYTDDNQVHRGQGQIGFGWVLQGRAIQDVWTLDGVFYGTTLRTYDPAIDAWHIIWSDPVRQYYTRQIGRAQGRSIVQVGKIEGGADVRWSFTEIEPGSFRWLGERSLNSGETWQLQADFRVRRLA